MEENQKLNTKLENLGNLLLNKFSLFLIESVFIGKSANKNNPEPV
jgi:hypothetical protein